MHTGHEADSSDEQARGDALFAWASASNLTLDLDDEQAARPEAIGQVLGTPDRVAPHISLLLSHVQASPARLIAAAREARRQHAEQAAAGADPAMLNCYLIAAGLADKALDQLRAAGAGDDVDVQRRLLDELHAEMFPDPEPFRPGLWDRNRLPRRLARRLDPRWWHRRRQLRRLPFIQHDAEGPSDIATIDVHRGPIRIGRVGYKICHHCRHALICKVSVDALHQNLGLGRRLVLAALHTAPGYRWTTTPQYQTAVRFWARMARSTGAELRADNTACPHMAEPTTTWWSDVQGI